MSAAKVAEAWAENDERWFDVDTTPGQFVGQPRRR